MVIRCRLFAIALVCALLANGCTQPPERSAETGAITIYRDNFGTPHIFADDNYGVYFGYGYALAEDRLYQMEMLKRTVEGRVAEVLGETFLALDTHIRTAYDHRAVRRQLAALAPADREILQAYADGFNRRIKDVISDRETFLPKEFHVNGFDPEPWTAYDAAMIFVGAIVHRYSDFNSELDNLQLLQHLQRRHGDATAWRIFNASKWLLDNDSPTTVPRTGKLEIPASTPPAYLDKLTGAPATKRVALNPDGSLSGTSDQPRPARTLRKILETSGFTTQPEFTPASNFWAVNRHRARNADGIFVNGPQFGWSTPSYVYGVGLHGGDFDVAGNTLLGLPALLFAHNNHIGWGSTAGLSDQVDVFVERLNPENPRQYFHDGEYKFFDSWDEVIRVRNAPPVTVKAHRSVHGMVQQLDRKKGLAYSRARAWQGAELQTLMAWVNLAKDRSLEDAQARIGKVAANINFYYMDAAGNLGYTHGGRYPKRRPGQDSRLPTPGDGAWDWLGYRPQDENPNIRNPAQGYIANWNNRPSGDWPSSDLWTYSWGRGDRTWFLMEALANRQTLDDSEVWAINRRVSSADVSAPFLLPHLLVAWQNPPRDATVARALKALANWNLEWQADKQNQYGAAPLLMENWLRLLLESVFKDDIGDEFFHLYAATNNPNQALGASMVTAPGTKALIKNLDSLRRGETPDYDFFNGVNPDQILRATFTDTVNMLVATQGPDISSWRLAAHPMEWKPYNFRGVPQTLENHLITLPTYMNRGCENNLFIAKNGGIVGYDVIPPGQSGHMPIKGEHSPHYADQMPLFANYRYKPVPFTREQVEQQSHRQLLISP